MRHLRSEAPGLHFVNADLIAAGLSPPNRGTGVEAAAGRLMLAEINSLAGQGRSFAFETTLAGRSYLRRIDRWRRDGYWVVLVFLSLGRPADAVRRVAERVRQGGHPVPEAVVRRRFDAGQRNLYEHHVGRVEELTESILRSLRLAAKDAHLLAYQTGTGVVTRHNGKVAVVPPDPAMYEDLIPPPFQSSD